MTNEVELSKLQRIKRYDIIRSVGEGGMAKVYLATDKIIRRPVAIKIFSLESVPGEGASKEKIMRDFFLETQTAGALLHPNIVVIYDVGKKGDLLYMVMEFVYGKTLREHRRSSTFSIKKSLELIYELAMALDYAHSKAVVHRDIKPENIIISAQGVPKITDFGIARFRRHLKGHRPLSLVGSSRFMAPEQVLRGEQDHRVDIYQLGVVLFELLTRHNPFKGATSEATLARICTETPPPAAQFNPDIPAQINAIVARCLEKSPTKRFQTAGELASALAEYLRSGAHEGVAPDRELVDRVRKFELFSLLSDGEIGELVKAGEFVTCRAGEYIIPENASDSDFFVLLEGNVTVEKGKRVLSEFLPGACFGEIGAFARQKRSAGVVARDACKLLRINAVLFQQLDPGLQLKMLHIVVRNLANLVISLDGEIVKLTDTEAAAPACTICPLCGYDNHAIIEVCPRCGVIPSMFEQKQEGAESADQSLQDRVSGREAEEKTRE